MKCLGSTSDQALFSSRFTFSRASTATYRDSEGILRIAAIDEPRFDDDAFGAPLGLLVERASSNLAIRSQDLHLPPWQDESVGGPDLVLPNSGIAPDGSTTATFRIVSGGTKAVISEHKSSTAGAFDRLVYVGDLNGDGRGDFYYSTLSGGTRTHYLEPG